MASARSKFLILLVIVAAVAAGIWWFTRPKPIKVVVAPVERGIVEETVANTRAGTVEACRRAKLSPAIGGQISVLNIKEGDKVKQGELLLSLWNEDLVAQLSLANSEHRAAKAKYESACLSADVAEREADRLSRLRQSGAVSLEALDKANTEAKALRADCRAANASVAVSQSKISVAEANLDRTRLQAPFDGVVAEINGELNEFVTPSPIGIPTPPAVDLIDSTCFYVAAPIDEVDAPKIRVDMTARVSLDAFRDRRFEGRVRRIADYVLDVAKQARTVDVEVEFVNKKDLDDLLAGYSADVEIILDASKDVLRIPTPAVLDDQRAFVFVESSGVLEERVIEIGISNWDHTEVLKGLEEGEKVVTSVDRAGVVDGADAVRDTEEK